MVLSQGDRAVWCSRADSLYCIDFSHIDFFQEPIESVRSFRIKEKEE